MIEELIALEKLKRELREYADSRVRDVRRGAETPELAALSVEKYGYDLAKAAEIFFDNNHVSGQIILTVDEVVGKIDPAFEENRQKRWKARPASLKF